MNRARVSPASSRARRALLLLSVAQLLPDARPRGAPPVGLPERVARVGAEEAAARGAQGRGVAAHAPAAAARALAQLADQGAQLAAARDVPDAAAARRAAEPGRRRRRPLLRHARRDVRAERPARALAGAPLLAALGPDAPLPQALAALPLPPPARGRALPDAHRAARVALRLRQVEPRRRQGAAFGSLSPRDTSWFARRTFFCHARRTFVSRATNVLFARDISIGPTVLRSARAREPPPSLSLTHPSTLPPKSSTSSR